MSPEQARGKAVDKRTDIWAFACCLFEALTGRKAFDGESATDIFAAIVDKEPDWNALPKDTPRPIERLLRRGLEKDLRHRLRDVGDHAPEDNGDALSRPPATRRSRGAPRSRGRRAGASFDNMTIHDHNQVMSTVGIAELKARLSEHLRKVRRGHSLTVLDRDTPIARIVPYSDRGALEIRRATKKPRDLRLPPPPSSRTDSLSVLLQDRASR